MRNRCDMFLKNNASVSWKLKTSGSPSEILELLITSTSTQKKAVASTQPSFCCLNISIANLENAC